MKRQLIVAIALAAFVCGGCVRRYNDTPVYSICGRQKAVVAVLPVINEISVADIPWDLSKELTIEIRKKVYESRHIDLYREPTSLQVAQLLSVPNPQAISKEAASSLDEVDFAVVAEVIQQQDKGFIRRTETGALFTCALRVRVVDLRGAAPKVILQEVIDKNYVLARPYMYCDYEKMAYGTEGFNGTPMGLAHNRLVKEVAQRIEAYIEAVM